MGEGQTENSGKKKGKVREVASRHAILKRGHIAKHRQKYGLIGNVRIS